MKLKTFNILDTEYDSQEILVKKRQLKKRLLDSKKNFKNIKIAVLAGSTVNEIVDDLELFLLNAGLMPTFYISQYGKYYEDAVFPPDELLSFSPDFIFIHVSYRNLLNLPDASFTKENTIQSLDYNKKRFIEIWTSLKNKFKCPIIQNNFDYCYFRQLGNLDCSDYRGKNGFISKMNSFISEYADNSDRFFINDLSFLQAKFGIDNFSDPKYWFMYKYAINVNYIPYFSFNVFLIIKSLIGLNKKVLNLDLDNTLWGGVIGDDGVSGIKLGQGDPESEYYQECQKYIKELKNIGVLLTVNSKNEMSSAIDGFNHPFSLLKKEDFVDISSNWNPKSVNLINTAKRLNLGVDSFVFVDDNPAERKIIFDNCPTVEILNFDENLISALDNESFFEPTVITKDDINRTNMYKDNFNRIEAQSAYNNIDEYLSSLSMEAVITPISNRHLERVTQLINKTNQFNLCVNRMNMKEVESICSNTDNLCICASLKDKFGDNGLVSCILGKKIDKSIEIVNWVMSCRVFQRGLEDALFNVFVLEARKKGIKIIKGSFVPTEKNQIVKDLYSSKGFKKESDSLFALNLDDYKESKHHISIHLK